MQPNERQLKLQHRWLEPHTRRQRFSPIPRPPPPRLKEPEQERNTKKCFAGLTSLPKLFPGAIFFRRKFAVCQTIQKSPHAKTKSSILTTGLPENKTPIETEQRKWITAETSVSSNTIQPKRTTKWTESAAARHGGSQEAPKNLKQWNSPTADCALIPIREKSTNGPKFP